MFVFLTPCYVEIAAGHVCVLMHVFVAPILSLKCPAVKGPFRLIQYLVTYVYKSTNEGIFISVPESILKSTIEPLVS